jgi:predicted peptidase
MELNVGELNGIMTRALGFLLVGICFVPFVWAADKEPIDPALLATFEPRVFKDSNGHTLRYRLFKPPAYDAKTNCPLVLFLHGAAGLGDDNARQFNGGNAVPVRALIQDDVQARYPCFILAPQCPRGEVWASLVEQPSEIIRLTLGALDELEREFKIDRQRLYIVGVSMGGHGVWDVVTKFPNTFAAAVPICAAGEPAKARRVTTLAIWCFHGAADTTVSVEYARKMIAALRQAGGHPKYTEYPGVGHDSYRNAFKEPELLPWLFAQKRND